MSTHNTTVSATSTAIDLGPMDIMATVGRTSPDGLGSMHDMRSSGCASLTGEFTHTANNAQIQDTEVFEREDSVFFDAKDTIEDIAMISSDCDQACIPAFKQSDTNMTAFDEIADPAHRDMQVEDNLEPVHADLDATVAASDGMAASIEIDSQIMDSAAVAHDVVVAATDAPPNLVAVNQQDAHADGRNPAALSNDTTTMPAPGDIVGPGQPDLQKEKACSSVDARDVTAADLTEADVKSDEQTFEVKEITGAAPADDITEMDAHDEAVTSSEHELQDQDSEMSDQTDIIRGIDQPDEIVDSTEHDMHDEVSKGSESSSDNGGDMEMEDEAPMASASVHDCHAVGCTGSPGASTPPSSPRLDIVETKAMAAYKILHQKATKFVPDEHFKASRYWIGIVNPGVQVKDIRREKDLTWMKGNARITTRTVHKTVQSLGTTNGEFDLMTGGQLFGVKTTVAMSDLDFCRDQCVIFQIVSQVIEID